MTEPRHHSKTVPSRRATPRDNRQDRSKHGDDSDDRRRSEADLQSGSNREWQSSDSHTSRATETRTESVPTRRDDEALVSAVEPPPTLVETPSRTPNGDEFWVGGHWLVDASGFAWQAGRIEQSRPDELYVTGYWAPTARGWEYTEEYWR